MSIILNIKQLRFIFLTIPLLCIFFFSSCLEAKNPDLTARDVKGKVEEILRSHVTHKRLTAELMERILQNFLEELDPAKCYFLEEEIKAWQHPSETYLQTLLEECSAGNYSCFHQIHALLEGAIARRSVLEESIRQRELPSDISKDDLKELPYSKTQEELFDRLLTLKALQAETARSMEGEEQTTLLQWIEKRRLNREADLFPAAQEERQKFVHATILKAVTSALDSHTNYFTPSEANQFMIQVQQRLFGIGAQLKDNLNGFLVMRILENSPASQSRLRMGDRIVAVSGEPVVGLDIIEAVDLIRGEKGTPVTLTVLRDNPETHTPDKLDIDLCRGEVVLDETRLETLTEPFGNGVIAHLKLFSFYQDQKTSSTIDMRKAIESIKKEHKLQGIVLDLRNNAGGILPQAVTVTGLFINKGIVVSIKDSSGKLQHLREVDGKPVWEGPLIVLVNRASASAAEIVAQTLQDYGRAIVVGDDHTFGKGTFQTFTLDPVGNPKVNPQGEYKVTRGRYYTVSGKSPQLSGVRSDIVIPGMLSYLDIGEEFSKYPLSNDEIDPHFDDDLSDLSTFHRLQLGSMYRYSLQQRLTTYVPFMEKLRGNSQKRLEGHKVYQGVLAELSKKNFDTESIEMFSQCDLQLHEAMNVMKDLIFLGQANHRAAA